MNYKKTLVTRGVAVGILLVAVTLPHSAAPVSARGADGAAGSTNRTQLAHSGDRARGRTPLQEGLQTVLEERAQAGLPVPQLVSYQYEVNNPQITSDLSAGPQQAVTVTATTTIQFDHPRQAGLDRWPDPVIEGTLPGGATGFVRAGDYSTVVRDELGRAIPGIWDHYVFGYEPRTYTFTETMTLPVSHGASLAALTLDAASEAAAGQELVMGLTTSGPRFNYLFNPKWETCVLGICVTLAEAKVGFQLDWDLGLRLPITVGLSVPAPLFAGQRPFSIAITGRDWSAQQFQQVGLEPVNGNEFVLRYVFFLGAWAAIGGVPVVDAAAQGAYDASRSFAAPLGPGASFPVPAMYIPPELTGLNWSFLQILSVGIGLSILPHLEAGGITADWRATGDADSSGQLTYSGSGLPVPFASIKVGDFNPNTSYATIRLNSFRYHFGQFSLQLGGELYVQLFGFGIKSNLFTLPAFDLSSLTGGLWLPTHAGTRSDLTATFLVAKTAAYLPTVASRPGR